MKCAVRLFVSSALYETISIDRSRLISDQSGHLFPDLVRGIHLACQSQVHEMQHISMAEKRREGGDVFLVWFQNLALFCSVSLQLSKLTDSSFKPALFCCRGMDG